MQSRGADCAHHISLSPQKYLTFRRPWHKRQTIAHRSQLRNLYCKYLPLIFKDKKPSYYSNVFWQENLKCFQFFIIDKKGKFSFLQQDTEGAALTFKISQNFQGYCWFNAVSQVFLFWFFKSQLSKLKMSQKYKQAISFKEVAQLSGFTGKNKFSR